jgi:NTE family protein
MTRPIDSRPDVLVLGAGGTLGIAWLRGVLAGLEDAAGVDWRDCDHLIGTSAGSVVAAALAAGRAPADDTVADAPDAAASADQAGDGVPGGPWWRAARAASAWAGAVASPIAPTALRVTAPGGALARAAALKAAPRLRRTVPGIEGYVSGLGSRFDGRLRVAAVDRSRGRRVMFGAPGAPKAQVASAVAASCAVPWLFSPVEIEGRKYVDGGVWSPTNLDAAPAGRGSEVICFMPTATPMAARSPLGALRAATHAAALTERAALRARGARVRLVAPDAASGRVMGPNLMDRSLVSEAYAAGLAQGRGLAG